MLSYHRIGSIISVVNLSVFGIPRKIFYPVYRYSRLLLDGQLEFWHSFQRYIRYTETLVVGYNFVIYKILMFASMNNRFEIIMNGL